MNQLLETTRFRVGGMDCASCAAKIDTAVRRLPGIGDVAVSVTAGTMTVRHGADGDLDRVERTVGALGYQVARLAASAPVIETPPACDCGHDHGHGHGEAHGKGHDHEGHDHGQDDAHEGCGGGDPPHGHDHGHGHGHATAATDGHAHGAATAAAAQAPDHDHGPTEGSWWTSPKGRLTVACGVALVVAFAVGRLVPGLGAAPFAVAMAVGLVPVAWRALQAARFGSPFTIEMLMTIAAIGATLIGAVEEAAAVVFLFLVGELLEGVAAGRARDGIRALAALVPKTALLRSGATTREVPAERLRPGDVVLVRPGDRLPADGVVVAGESRVDESPVTGESLGVRKRVDDTVFAGTINGEAALDVRVTSTARDNTIARVVRLVEEAQEAKAPTERLIDRFSRWYTPAVMGIAALVAVVPPLAFAGDWKAWIYKGLAILLIGCPCALVISVPAAIASGLSAGARRGLLIKGGAVLETLARTTRVCFDKTGTLTSGRPQVTDLVAFDGAPERLLALAAAVETGSSHPIAVAVLAKAAAMRIAPGHAGTVRALPGKGVAADVDGVEVFVGSPAAVAERTPLSADVAATVDRLFADGKTVAVVVAGAGAAPAGVIAVRDEPRPDAKDGLAALGRIGISSLVLTGDHRAVAEAIGRDLGVAVRAELLPTDKLAVVAELRARGEVVVKVGDGINDAPALAAADVGIAMGGGTDVALETADAAVLHGRVGDVAAMIELARRTLGTIRQNIAVALGLKALFLATTVVGITGLWPAILADTGATVLVTLNALRLLSVRPGAFAKPAEAA